jgi:Mg2+ and Co2+ transporter CorA
MLLVRDRFQEVISQLKKMEMDIKDLRREIRIHRDQLYAGTSILESRKSVELAAVSILEGHNIKLLGFVSIIFLPAIFVATVFGMRNIPREISFKPFAATFVAICVPVWLLISTLNTTSTVELWRHGWYQLRGWISGMHKLILCLQVLSQR